MSNDEAAAGAARRQRHRRRTADDTPVLPDRSTDDLDRSWGDGPGERDADWYERERPPHHE